MVGAHAVGVEPRAHEQVARSLGRAVRRTRPVGRLLGEAGGVVQRQIAVDLVGRDVVEADIVPARRLQQRERASHVGLEEGSRVRYRVVVVGLGSEVHAGIGFREQAVDQTSIANVANNELDLITRQPGEVLRVAGVGELIEHRDALHLGMIGARPVHEVGADEPGPSGDDKVHRVPPSSVASPDDALFNTLPSRTLRRCLP